MNKGRKIEIWKENRIRWKFMAFTYFLGNIIFVNIFLTSHWIDSVSLNGAWVWIRAISPPISAVMRDDQCCTRGCLGLSWVCEGRLSGGRSALKVNVSCGGVMWKSMGYGWIPQSWDTQEMMPNPDRDQNPERLLSCVDRCRHKGSRKPLK